MKIRVDFLNSLYSYFQQNEPSWQNVRKFKNYAWNNFTLNEILERFTNSFQFDMFYPFCKIGKKTFSSYQE